MSEQSSTTKRLKAIASFTLMFSLFLLPVKAEQKQPQLALDNKSKNTLNFMEIMVLIAFFTQPNFVSKKRQKNKLLKRIN